MENATRSAARHVVQQAPSVVEGTVRPLTAVAVAALPGRRHRRQLPTASSLVVHVVERTTEQVSILPLDAVVLNTRGAVGLLNRPIPP